MAKKRKYSSATPHDEPPLSTPCECYKLHDSPLKPDSFVCESCYGCRPDIHEEDADVMVYRLYQDGTRTPLPGTPVCEECSLHLEETGEFEIGEDVP